MIVTPDTELEAAATEQQVRWNAGCTLRLFQNNLTPDPTVLLADFVEATFSGYAAVDLTGEFSAPVKTSTGHWQFSSDQHTFAHGVGAVDNTIHGWWIDDGTSVLACERFGAAIPMATGSLPFALTINATAVAQSEL